VANGCDAGEGVNLGQPVVSAFVGIIGGLMSAN